MSQQALELGLISDDTHKLYAGAYLHRSFKEHERLNTTWLSRHFTRIQTRTRTKLRGEAMKGKGIFLPVPIDRLVKDVPDTWYADVAAAGNPNLKDEPFVVLDRINRDGKVGHRVYWPAGLDIPSAYTDYTNQGTFIGRGRKNYKGNDTVFIWRDYSKEELVNMGAILDARYAVARTYHTLSHDLSTGKFYSQIAADETMSRDEVKDGIPKDVIFDPPKRFDTYTLAIAKWIRVPTTNIAQSSTPKWGLLAGRLVRPEVWRDLNELEQLQQRTLWRDIVTFFKKNKTTRSWRTHVNNFMSNLVLMDLVDVRVRDLILAMSEWKQKGHYFEQAMAKGAIGTGLLDIEMRKNMLEPILKELEQDIYKTDSPNAMLMGLQALQMPWNLSKATDEKAAEFYQWQDDIFRLALFIRSQRLGDDPVHAAMIARDQFVNYDIRAPWVNFLRQNGIPFLSYNYRLLPILLQSVQKRPWKIAKYAIYSYLITQLMLAIGGDDDEAEKSLPEWLQGRTLMGIPKAFPTGVHDSAGDPVFLQTDRWVPGNDIAEAAPNSAAPWLQAFNPGGPLLMIFEYMMNRSMFTGKDITNTLTDTPMEKVSKTLSWLWQSMMPDGVYVPGSRTSQNFWRPMENEEGNPGRSISGKDYTWTPEILNALGIKARGHNKEESAAFRGFLYQRSMREIEAAIRILQIEHQSGKISTKKFERDLDGLLKHFENLKEKIDEDEGQ